MIDAGLCARVADAYNGSIGGWRKAVNDEKIVHAFYNFQDRQIAELALEYLRANAIEAVWT